MRVVWTPEAEQDRADIWDYIAADSPHSAAGMDELFSQAAARLHDYISGHARKNFRYARVNAA